MRRALLLAVYAVSEIRQGRLEVVMEVVIRHRRHHVRRSIPGAITALGTPVTMRRNRTGHDENKACGRGRQNVVHELTCCFSSTCFVVLALPY